MSVDVMAEFRALVGKMSPEDKAEFDRMAMPILENMVWLPNPGPQTEAYFSRADLLLYGGAAGGGKTDLLIGLAQNEHQRSVIFRRAYTDLKGIEDRLIEMRKGQRAGYNGADMRLKWGDGKLLEFGALEKPRSEYSWQGRPHDFIGYDEGAQLTAKKIAFTMGWLRSTIRGQRKRVIIASNPPLAGDGEFLIEWFAPWLDPNHPDPAAPGELRWAYTDDDEENPRPVWVDGPEPLYREDDGTVRRATMEDADLTDIIALEDNERIIQPLSRTFIPARLKDNPYLRGTGYVKQLQGLPEPLRTQLIEGDFLAGRKDHDRQVIPSEWIRLAQQRWNAGKPKGVPMTTLGVDIAQGGSNKTCMAPLYLTWFDKLIKRAGVDTKDGDAVAGLVVQHMKDGAIIVPDMGGGWGGGTTTALKNKEIDYEPFTPGAGSGKTDRSGKLGLANLRAEAWWGFREALDPSQNDPSEMPALPPDERLFAQLSIVRYKLRGAIIVVEAKEDIKKRLDGQSTDEADAVIQAWWAREKALRRALRRKKKNEGRSRQKAINAYDPLDGF